MSSVNDEFRNEPGVKRRRLIVSTSSCGNCRKWMTSDCIPEQTDKIIRSRTHRACNRYDHERKTVVTRNGRHVLV